MLGGQNVANSSTSRALFLLGPNPEFVIGQKRPFLPLHWADFESLIFLNDSAPLMYFALILNSLNM